MASDAIMPYTNVYRSRVLNTCLYRGFGADLADRAKQKPLNPLFSTTSSGSNPTLSANHTSGAWTRRPYRVNAGCVRNLTGRPTLGEHRLLVSSLSLSS